MQTTVNQNFNGSFEVVIRHLIEGGYKTIYPIVEDGVKWETDRQGSPSKLTFKVYCDDVNKLNFQEGDVVILRFQTHEQKWVTPFVGYIFTKKRTKDNWIDVTAYDQLRYLKNKATYVYKEKRASDIVKMIANDYFLNLGTIDDTGFVIAERVEDDQTLFDIIQNALDLTLIGMSRKTRYVLYDDSGKLCLRDINDLKLNLVINDSVAEDFDYTSTIDEEVYNEVELYYDDDTKNERLHFAEGDSTNIAKWGRLRLTQNIQDPTNGEEQAKNMLELYNRKHRTLKVNKAFGDYRCRAGASVIVLLNLGDISVSNYMLIEKATHTFTKDEYRMDLTLGGTTEFA